VYVYIVVIYASWLLRYHYKVTLPPARDCVCWWCGCIMSPWLYMYQLDIDQSAVTNAGVWSAAAPIHRAG
jgi:hypothetical protein